MGWWESPVGPRTLSLEALPRIRSHDAVYTTLGSVVGTLRLSADDREGKQALVLGVVETLESVLVKLLHVGVRQGVRALGHKKHREYGGIDREGDLDVGGVRTDDGGGEGGHGAKSLWWVSFPGNPGDRNTTTQT